VHWATWALQRGFITPADVASIDLPKKAHSDTEPLLAGLHDFWKFVIGNAGSQGTKGSLGTLAGCDNDVYHLSSRLLDLLPLVRHASFPLELDQTRKEGAPWLKLVTRTARNLCVGGSGWK
jgi:hypothetical protein